jgi:hypothetical protein
MEDRTARVAEIMRAAGPESPEDSTLLSILAILEMSMLKKLLPAILGALLVASPVIAVTTAAAAPQAASSGSMKSTHHKSMHKKSSHHSMKKHAKKKAPK